METGAGRDCGVYVCVCEGVRVTVCVMGWVYRCRVEGSTMFMWLDDLITNVLPPSSHPTPRHPLLLTSHTLTPSHLAPSHSSPPHSLHPSHSLTCTSAIFISLLFLRGALLSNHKTNTSGSNGAPGDAGHTHPSNRVKVVVKERVG